MGRLRQGILHLHHRLSSAASFSLHATQRDTPAWTRTRTGQCGRVPRDKTDRGVISRSVKCSAAGHAVEAASHKLPNQSVGQAGSQCCRRCRCDRVPAAVYGENDATRWTDKLRRDLGGVGGERGEPRRQSNEDASTERKQTTNSESVRLLGERLLYTHTEQCASRRGKSHWFYFSYLSAAAATATAGECGRSGISKPNIIGGACLSSRITLDSATIIVTAAPTIGQT